MAGQVPERAQVVIIGGGIVGASVAFHLTELGWTDVVLLERHTLTSGATWHAAGLVGRLRATHNMTRLAAYSADLYERLEHEMGHPTGFKKVGSVSLADNPGRVFTRDQLLQDVWGFEYSGDTRTVDVHVRWLRLKIEEDPAKPRLLGTVRGVGYRFNL